MKRSALEGPVGNAAPAQQAFVQRPPVLIVDDDPVIVDDFGRLLQLEGFDATASGSAEHAAEQLARSVYLAVLCDLNLPKRSGIQLLRDVRSAGNETPFLFVTGCATVTAAVEAMKLGAVDFLEKPVLWEHILCALWRLVEDASRLSVDERVMRVIREIRRDPARPVDLASLSRQFGITASRLAHLFHDAVGYSTTRFRNQERMRRARAQLAGTRRRVSEVGYELGFESGKSFARAFALSEGASPREYRRRQLDTNAK